MATSVSSASEVPVPQNACREEIRCIAVGDASSGKKQLLAACEKIDSNTEQSVFLEYTTCKVWGDFMYRFVFKGFSGQERTHNLRRLSYVHPIGVFLVCFSVIDEMQFCNAITHWVKEIQTYARESPFLLVGTHSDLRKDRATIRRLRQQGKKVVSRREAEQMAATLGVEYFECSFKELKTVRKVFTAALKAAANGPVAKEIRSLYPKICHVM